MSGRCRSCDVILFEEEMCQKWPDSDEYIDLCHRCLEIAMNPDAAPDYYEQRNDNYYEE